MNEIALIVRCLSVQHTTLYFNFFEKGLVLIFRGECATPGAGQTVSYFRFTRNEDDFNNQGR